MDTIPNELLYEIFQHISDIGDIGRLSMVSRKFNEFLTNKNNMLWKIYCEKIPTNMFRSWLAISS